MTEERRDWRELCVAITREADSAKFLQLMEGLLALLDERQNFISAGGAKYHALEDARSD